MNLSFGFRLFAVSCSAMLLITAFTFSSTAIQGGKARDAVQKAEKKLAEAEKAAKECEDAKLAAKAADEDADKAEGEANTATDEAAKAQGHADDSMSKVGASKTDADKAADKAADDADKAANDADDALDKGEKGAKDKDAAAGKAEAASSKADQAAGKADENMDDPQVKAAKADAREKRKAARAARRKARAARRAANAKDKLAEEKCNHARDLLKDAEDALKAAQDELDKDINGGAKDTGGVGGRIKKVKDKLDDLKKAATNSPTPNEPVKSVEPPKAGAAAAPPNAGQKTTVANGLQTITFDTPRGQINVNLPDDMRAGDTISGTVVTEPKGNTPEEKAKNQDVLNGYVIDLGGTTVDRPRFTWTPPQPNSSTPVRYELKVIEVLPPPRTENGAVITPQPKIVERAVITPYPKITYPTTPSGAVITPDPKTNTSFIIPPLGQTGRPIVITGPFDGNFDNTKLALGDQTLAPLAESPRKVVVQSPSNVTGPAEIKVKEGANETKGSFRNVGVNLTAPKTSLMKGESTTLKVEVSGLQGITEPVPLHLTKGGVVTMQGGDVQTMSIKPTEVQSNGTFTTTRSVTGVQTGVWNATATVVVFDFCLQDDNNGSLLIFSSTTGDYIFCQGPGTGAGANPISLSTLNFMGTDFTGGVRVSAADVNEGGVSPANPVNIDPGASITRNGGITVADFNYKIGYVHVQIDDYSHTGNASGYVYQQVTIPGNASPKKINFTITDRDTRNNTCACK